MLSKIKKLPTILNIEIDKVTQIYPQIALKKKKLSKSVNEGSSKVNAEKEETATPIFPELSIQYNFANKILDVQIKWKKSDCKVVCSQMEYIFSKEKINIMIQSDKGSIDLRKFERHAFYDNYILHLKFEAVDDTTKKKIKTTFYVKYEFRVPNFQCNTPFKKTAFNSHDPEDELIDFYNAALRNESLNPKHLEEYISKDFFNQRSLTLIDKHEYAVKIEDLSVQESYSKYSVFNAELTELGDVYFFEMPKEKIPDDIQHLVLILVPMKTCKSTAKNFRFNYAEDSIYAQIERISEYKFMIGSKPLQHVFFKKWGKLNTRKKYYIRFAPSRYSIQAALTAINLVKLYKLQEYFTKFETQSAAVNLKRTNRPESAFAWENKAIASNKEQMIAIRNICNSTANPYVVFGPPGTGKTSCLVECIVQILKFSPDAKIVVSAQSNSACDEIGVRLLKYISINKVFRYYSPSLVTSDTDKTNSKLRKTSNLKLNRLPSEEEFFTFNVLIVTLASSALFGRLVLPKNYFNYIFIDECAACNEPEALIPILGLGATLDKMTSNIVLFGDHKQLGAIIDSQYSISLGLETSLMERIMSLDRYSANPDYNNEYVTQLLDNYRSHVDILKFSNDFFYNSKLRAVNKSVDVYLGSHWKKLPKPGFPIIFHCSKNPSSIESNGTSSFNKSEAFIVQLYISDLLKNGIESTKITANDIGVVTPYRAQLEYLKQILPKNIEIGTAEYFQGREKLIIIISTVKSRTGVGFLKNEKRLNVCITRAKSLLIIVGNPDTLQLDEFWGNLIKFIKVNGGYRGKSFKIKEVNNNDETEGLISRCESVCLENFK